MYRMQNLVEVNYAQTGESTSTDALGMREMQARAFAARDALYLLIRPDPKSLLDRDSGFIVPGSKLFLS